MILIFAFLSCGGKDSSKESIKDHFENSKEKTESIQEEKYRKVIDDLEESKNDMRCIKNYITVQQQSPEEKLDYIAFEETECANKMQ